MAKWLDRGLDSDKHNFLVLLDFSRAQDPKVKSVLFMVAEVFRSLPIDSQAGNLMQFLCNMMTAKLKITDAAKQESIDVALGNMNLSLNFMGLIRDWLHPKRLEIH